MYDQMYDNALICNWNSDGGRLDLDLIVATIHRLRPGAVRILDFGCYTGGLLARLRGRCELFGIEINREAATIARHSTGATVWSAVSDVPPHARFDVVVASDVVEHIHKPDELIEELMSLLTPNGILIITTGDSDAPLWRLFGANWWYCYYAEHISFISQAWLEYLSRTSSVSVLEIEKFTYRQLGPVRRRLDTAALYFYGHFPRTYITLKKTLQRFRGRDGLPSVPGNGISPDHLLAVLEQGSTR